MQFSTITLLLATLLPSVLANRAATIKAGLRVVGNHGADQYHDQRKAAQRDHQEGFGLNHGHHMSQAREGQDRANRIGAAVGGVKRPRSLELIGRDDTHEYFARELPEEDSLFARDFAEDFDDLWY